ncbi:hypothetical protein V2G26_011240 [Clonostachys chloroleuca]
MVTSVISASHLVPKPAQSGSEESILQAEQEQSPENDSDATNTTICLTIFIFRGEPDMYFKRHVILYFTSPELPDFCETVHIQRVGETGPWMVDRARGAIDWALEANYCAHVNAGAVVVNRGEEMVPVAVTAGVPVQSRLNMSWNCQNFVLEGLQALVDEGFQTQEWYSAVEDELVERLMDGTVG